MAALRSRGGHYILQLWFLSFFLLLSCFFPRVISAVADWMSTIEKIAKNSPSAGYIFATKAFTDNPKIGFKHQYLLHVFSQYGEFRPISG